MVAREGGVSCNAPKPPFSITSPEGDADEEGGLEDSISSSRHNAWKGLMHAKNEEGGRHNGIMNIRLIGSRRPLAIVT